MAIGLCLATTLATLRRLGEPFVRRARHTNGSLMLRQYPCSGRPSAHHNSNNSSIGFWLRRQKGAAALAALLSTYWMAGYRG